MAKKIISGLGVMMIVLVGVRYSAGQTVTKPADTILVNGNIIKVDPKFTSARALAIADGKILAVGSTDEIRKFVGPQTRQIDLHGKTVAPGLIDAHIHDAGDGPGVDLYKARSLDDVLAAIAARIRESKPGDLIVTNSGWHEGQLKEQRLPLRRERSGVCTPKQVVEPRVSVASAASRW